MLGPDVLVELLEAGVLRGEAALGGSIDDEDYFAFVVGEGDLDAAPCGVRVVVSMGVAVQRDWESSALGAGSEFGISGETEGVPLARKGE